MKNQILLFVLLFSSFLLNAQNSFTITRELRWANEPSLWTLLNGDKQEVWKFEGCSYPDEARSIPVFSERFPISGNAKISAEVVSVQWEAFSKKKSMMRC